MIQTLPIADATEVSVGRYTASGNCALGDDSSGAGAAGNLMPLKLEDPPNKDEESGSLDLAVQL